MIEAAASHFESSRRLTGPNLYFGDCGAVLEVREASVEQCEAWKSGVRAMREDLDWADRAVVAHRYESGASLAFAAAIDQLFTATEVNEWAWLHVAGEAAGLPLPHAPGHPASWDFYCAANTLRRLAAAEARPQALLLMDAAARLSLPAFLDDDALSVGAGNGSVSWPLDALPVNSDGIDWAALHDIPTVLVTGTNGKTTTVRLVSAMCAAAGLSAGFNCTDGIFIAGEVVEPGDFSGPAGARQVLRDPRVEAAVLETARGGILRRGLAVRRANAAIVTNVSPDHFGEYGVHDLSDLADAKLVVARAISADGRLVLNADDAMLREKSSALTCPLAWFALDDAHPQLVASRAAGNPTCAVSHGRLVLRTSGVTYPLGAVDAMPMTFGGSAQYNIANIAGASLLAYQLGVPVECIASVLKGFGNSRNDNPGRLERWRVREVQVLLDYAHNPEGLAGLLAVAGGLRQRGSGRLGLLLGQAGNRDDDALRALARIAAAAQPDRVVLKDLAGYMRGRRSGEVPAVLADELRAAGVAAAALTIVLDEVEAAQSLLDWAAPGDIVVLPVHNLTARGQLVAWLEALQAIDP